MLLRLKNVMRAMAVSGLLCLLALLLPAQAAGGSGPPSLDRLLPKIRRHTPGSLYDVEGPYKNADGKRCYRIKWMTPEGRIIWYEIDAGSGRILGMVTGTLPSVRQNLDGPPPWPPPPAGELEDGRRTDGWHRDGNR
jgi:hypothetical protein